jgi:hypothetical protein
MVVASFVDILSMLKHNGQHESHGHKKTLSGGEVLG